MKDFYKEFSFGRKETTIWQYAIIGFVLDLLLTLAVRFGLDRKATIRLIDQFIREFKLDRVNDFIIRDEEWLDVRVDADIAEAIESYQLTDDWEAVKMAETIYTEKESDGSEAQNLLGGEMRATYDFVINQEDNEL